MLLLQATAATNVAVKILSHEQEICDRLFGKFLKIVCDKMIKNIRAKSHSPIAKKYKK